MIDGNALFFTCSLIELIAREHRLRRRDVVDALGTEVIRKILSRADVLHCEPIAKVAEEIVEHHAIPSGECETVAKCRYRIPDYWEIGAVFARLIEDTAAADAASALVMVYRSFLSDAICRFNSDLYYQPRQYLAECLKAGEILAA